MNFTKTNVVFFSATQVSKKYAMAMAETFGNETVVYDITLPQNRDAKNAPSFKSDELVIVSLPIYGGRIPLVCDEYINALKGDNTPCIVIGTYGNRHYDDAVVEMEDILKSKGFKIVGGAAPVGRHSFTDNLAGDRPSAQDLDSIKEFAKKIIANDFKEIPQGTILGARPYKERGAGGQVIAPETTDDCVNCKICAKKCPMGIISLEEPKDFAKDAGLCIKCNSCVVYCPKQAKKFTSEGYLKIVQYLETNFSQPDRENEYFI